MRTEDPRQTLEANGLAAAGAAEILPAPLFEPAPVAELVTDPAGVIQDVTPDAAVLLRVEPGFLRGVVLRTLVRREDLPRLRVLLVGEAVHDGATVRLAVPGGRSVSAELTVTAARDPQGLVTGLRWRVRERRRAARRAESDASAALRHRLEPLVVAGHGVCLVGAAGIVTWAGQAALDMLGRDRDEVVGREWADLAPEGSAGPLSLALRRGREGSGTFPSFSRGDGGATALDYVVAPLIEDDRVLGVALAFTQVGV